MSELEFWKDLGNIYDIVMDYQKKNVEFNARFINPWIRLGNVFEHQDAVDAYKRATEIDPDGAKNWADLGEAHFKNGAVEESIDAYRKAVTLDPEAGWPLGNLALSLVSQGRVEEAIPLYKKSIDLLIEFKDKAVCWNRLGNAYRKLNDYDNATLAFQKADQLDNENTGFNDTLDETPQSAVTIAPEEALEQMIVEQPEEIQQVEVESAHAEETAQLEFDLTHPVESADEVVALAPSMEMPIDEIVEEEVAQILDEVNVAALEQAVMEEEESPLDLHEKKFDLLEVVENIIAKVEQVFVAKEEIVTDEAQVIEEVAAEAEMSVAIEEPVLEVEAPAAIEETEEVVLEVETPTSIEEIEEVVLEVEAPVVTEEAVQEVEPVSEEVTLEVIAEAESEPVAVEVEAPVAAEEISQEVEAVAAEVEASVELVVEDAPRQAPAWLVVKINEKAEEVAPAAEIETAEETAQVESVTTLSDISQEAAVSESLVNMDVVETYTDALPALSEESVGEAVEQIEAANDAVIVAQEMIVEDKVDAADESAGVDESSMGTLEAAYEEYLKDAAAPVNTLNDHVNEIHSDVPATIVGKDGEVRIEMDTKNAHVWNELGNIYLNAGAYDDAIDSYRKAIDLDHHFAWPYSNLALAYVHKGRFAESVLLYQRGIELFVSDKDKAVTWNRLGNVYRRINDYNNAIGAYQTADELDPENATISLRSNFSLLGNMQSEPKPAFV